MAQPSSKRPDGATLVPWKRGRVLVWDATCPDTLAPSHSSLANREAGAVAADAEHRKQQEYAHLDGSLFFVPVAVETLGVFGAEARALFRDIARRITTVTQDPLSHHQYLVQRVAVAVQRGNAAAVLGTMSGGCLRCMSVHYFF